MDFPPINSKKLRNLPSDLKRFFQNFDACYLLCFYSFYFLTPLHGKGRDDREMEGHLQSNLEILQAFALMQNRTPKSNPLGSGKDKFVDSVRLLVDYPDIHDFNYPDTISPELRGVSTINQMRSQTMIVRNWAYKSQMNEVIVGLTTAMDSQFRKMFNLPGSVIAKIFTQIPEMVGEQVKGHQIKVFECMHSLTKKGALKTYNKLFGDTTPGITYPALSFKGRSRIEFREDLKRFTDLWLPACYSFSVDDLVEAWGLSSGDDVREFVEMLSCSFGDTRSYSPKDIFLDNPVRLKPLIKLDENTFLYPGLAFLLDCFLDIVDNLMSESDESRARYARVRSLYTEKFVSKTLSSRFGSSQLFEGVSWSRRDRPGVFETDHLLVIDKVALVFESKSGKVTRSARRGGWRAMDDYVERLMLEPLRQAHNFIEAAERNLITGLKIKSGDSASIDFQKIKHYIPVAVTLEFLGALVHVKPMVEDGNNKNINSHEIGLCMSMTDLECILKVLSYDAMFVHYLARRLELESHCRLGGHEVDLLQFYIDGAFNDIGEDEYSDRTLVCPIQSAGIDGYMAPVRVGRSKPPTLYLTQWWRFILDALDKSRPNGWLEASFALLNCPVVQQHEAREAVLFISRGRKQRKLSQEFRLKHPAIVIGPRKRKIILQFFLYEDIADSDREMRMRGLLARIDHDIFRLSVVLGINVGKNDLPCEHVVVSTRSQLLEKPMEIIHLNS